MVARNAYAGLAEEHTDFQKDAHVVAGSRLKWRREFNVVNATYWDEFESGGITIPDPVSGTITVNMGTTANAESWLVSKQIFTFPLKAAVGIQLSQKIANNEVYVELVGCDAAGVLDETRVAAWRIAGSDTVTATNARSEVRNGAAARRQSANLATVSHVGAVAIMEITAESDEVWFSSKASDTTTARSVGSVMNLVSPDPEGLYKLRIRFKNGAVAPASATTVTLQFALAIDYTEMQVEVLGGNGNQGAGQGIPIIGVGGSMSVTASIVGNGLQQTTSVANLAGAATFTGTALDAGSGGAVQSQSIRASVQHLAGLTPGYLIFEESLDAVTYVESQRVPIPSDNMVHTFEFPVNMRASRVKFTNGATAQTAFRFASNAVRVGNSTFASERKNLNFPLSVTALAIATAFSQTLDLGANHPWNLVRAAAFADQAGTIFIDESRDGTTWRTEGAGQAVGIGGYATLEKKVTQRYVRFRYLNGGVASTAFAFDGSLVSL